MTIFRQHKKTNYDLPAGLERKEPPHRSAFFRFSKGVNAMATLGARVTDAFYDKVVKAASREGGRENAAKERIWFSPHCLTMPLLFDMGTHKQNFTVQG